MLTKRDVRRLCSQMADEMNASLSTVLISGLLLLLLALLAWWGAAPEAAALTLVRGDA